MTIFDSIDGFHKHEKWGDWRKMSGTTLMCLAMIRKKLRKLDPDASIVINCGYETEGHVGKTHPRGQAVDFYVSTTIPYHELIGHMLEIFHELQISRIIGFGVYPCWNRKGFHFDNRGFEARWGYVFDMSAEPVDGVYPVKQVSMQEAVDVALLLEMEEEI